MAGRYKPYPEYKNSGGDSWFNCVPTHWQIKKISYVAHLRSGDAIVSEQIEIEGNHPVYGGNGFRGYTENFNYNGSYILIGRQGALCGNINYGHGKFWASEHAVVVRPFIPLNYRWLGETLRAMDLNQYNVSAAQPGLAVANITCLKIPFPSFEEQEKIANFLDHETSKIDTLIEKQQQLIKLLKEKRQAVISHVVTKGLNPNAKMRDSGNEWLGEVPEGWVVVNVRNLIRAEVLEIQDGNHGELHPVAAEYVDDGVPFLMANNVQNGTVSLRESKYISLERAEKLRIGFSQPNDLLLTHKGTVGEVALVPESIDFPYWMLTPQITYYRWKSKRYLSRFFYMFFRSSCFQVQLDIIGGKQSTRAYVGLIAQGDLILAVPPIDEQSEICSYLESAVSDYEYLISKAESAITFSQERRTALISAVVTGKIDVRNWVASKANQTNKEVAA